MDSAHTPLNWDELVKERDAWVAHNFPTTEETAPMETIMGVFEEIGELTHAHLKQRQSIRGSDEEHVQAAQDAVGDATVYLLGVLSFTGHRPREPIHRIEVREADDCLLQAGAAAGTLFRYMQALRCERIRDKTRNESWQYVLFDGTANKLVYYLFLYCDRRGWDYGEIVQRTWDEVKKRDWVLYPDTGLPPATHAPEEAFDPVTFGPGGVCPICLHAGGNPTLSGCDLCED
jgi:hypothetical protein